MDAKQTQIRAVVVDELARQIAGDFGPYKPAASIRHTFSVLGKLRETNELSWNEIGELFNAARARHSLLPMPTATICRLFHLERARQLLASVSQAPQKVVPVPGPPSDRESPSLPRPPIVASKHEPGQHSHAREGPAPAGPSVNDAIATATVRREFKAIKNRNTEDE